ncbi:hypothetical protein COT97_05390 [Candidatus Falkowbacteria bacterium CG10_big_fil_rev_8_21_14_0_10_39_11]|uniref:N-acetyltransferase domain-containing protein n=1 Tax=Candidatus Falkowbacteria bacterium CG10_big_fil_rev_8_21_14_0_10_39_11 TaxID=1974565 RepID=A0A2H0V3K6_9BACT|nr:MAG: hypothetical protein COT97_05390 [Candidatus Falkowbacteria bacterium CG10_big_fil_rev_8_21_14_0_10_39_11]
MISFRYLQVKDDGEIRKLFTQLTKNPVDFDVEFLVNHKFAYCRVMEDDGRIIGFAALIVHPVPTKGLVARVEDVVLDKEYRGRGLGKKIMEDLIEIAKSLKIQIIILTSNPKRIPARNLYESLGFNLIDTGVFLLKIDNQY